MTPHRFKILPLLTWSFMLLSCSRQEPAKPASQTSRHIQEQVAAQDAGTAEAATPDQSMAKDTNDPWDEERPDPRKDLPELSTRPDTWRRGVALGLFATGSTEDEQRKIYRELLDEIVAVGATDLSLVVRWSQSTVKDHVIEARDGVTVPDELVVDVIQAAHERGLRTFLLPIIWLEHREMGIWRGTIAPHDMDAWWEHYTRFIHHYADLAQRQDVALLSVGSELLSMETEEARWRALIESTRKRYKGELTYSANWDHFEVPAYWDALDVVGMTAYQELSKNPNPELEELTRGWSSFHRRLRRWATEHDYRYIFTEIGYPSHRQGAQYPWNYSANAPAAPWLQARCYRAMMEKWESDKRLDGLYVWNWFGFKDLEDRGYTPRGKPAEQVLEHWYKSTKEK